MKTLLLDLVGHDLVLDINGDIALASEPYAVAQDAASAIKTVEGEVYYDTTLGIPYFRDILGHRPPVSLMKADFVAAALTVPDTVSAICYLFSEPARGVGGQVQIKLTSGQTVTASTGAP